MFRFFTENWQLKLLSAGCALILWSYVMGERRLEVGYTVPVELRNVPQGLVVVSEVPNAIDIRLSGPQALLSDLDQKNIRISVDLAGLKPGLTTFSRLDDYLKLPVGIRATRTSPSFFDVRLDRVAEKKVTVRPHLTGSLPDGYRLAAIEARPQKVTLSGGEAEIAPVSEVMTERIDLGGIKESGAVEVGLNYRGKYSQVKENGKIRVRLQIEPVKGRRSS